MAASPELLFYIAALLTVVAVPLYAWRTRGGPYAAFSLVILSFALPGAFLIQARLSGWLTTSTGGWILEACFAYGMLTAGLHLLHLVHARLRSLPYRLAVSIPGQTFIAAGFLCGGWLLLMLPIRATLLWLGLNEPLELLGALDFVPLAAAGLSVVTSLRTGEETVRIDLGQQGSEEVARVPVERFRRKKPAPVDPRPLRVVQISDPHVGPWQSVEALRGRIASLVERAPDLVLLTGDYLTMESMGTRGALSRALEPLRKLPEQCYAIFGNHDHEAPEEVRGALQENDIRLLVDEEAIAQTEVGPVQIIGADYVRREREAHLDELLARFPRVPGHLRLLLLHDPSAFVHVSADDVDLTLSGHTHGGQVGLVSLGLDWTVLSGSRWPDHGLFARGSNLLYVHRGTGFYGFPLRVGVPGEESLLELVTPA